jgi:ABC-type dipeptide/oligopeptide/nickel transport system ATPase subunit
MYNRYSRRRKWGLALAIAGGVNLNTVKTWVCRIGISLNHIHCGGIVINRKHAVGMYALNIENKLQMVNFAYLKTLNPKELVSCSLESSATNNSSGNYWSV